MAQSGPMIEVPMDPSVQTNTRKRPMCDNHFDTSLSRRHALMLAGAGMLAAAPLGSMAQAQPASAAGTPDEALKLLVEGNARYAANDPRERDFSAGRANRALGQAPFAAILG